MSISLRPTQLRRHRDIARLLVKHGRADLASQVGLDACLDDADCEGAGDAASRPALLVSILRSERRIKSESIGRGK